MDTVSAGLAIVGFVNGLRLLQEKSYWGFIFFAVAVALGTLFGFLHWFGLTIADGFLAGLASSGLYRVGEKVGGTK